MKENVQFAEKERKYMGQGFSPDQRPLIAVAERQKEMSRTPAGDDLMRN